MSGLQGLWQHRRTWERTWGRRAAMAGAIAAALIPVAALAADMDTRGRTLQSAYDWTITIGVEGKVEPIFPGSKDFAIRPNPIFDIRRYGTPERFRGPRDGIGFGLIEGSNYQIGAVGALRIPRRESDDPAALHGLGNVPWAVELGGFAEYWFVPWLRSRAEVRQGVHGHHGLVADLMVDAVVPVTSQLTLSGGPRATLVTAAANSPYFSIDVNQSVASGLPVYAAGGGLKSVGAGAQARYFWTPQWATHVFVEYERLTDDAANSPLVTQRGSPDQVTIGFGVTRSFDIKQPW
jgi:outer membrane protein